MLVYLLLALGLVLLMLGGDWLVKGAVGLANRYGISPLIIGLTIVAFGTSAPELVVSLDAAWIGKGGLAVGNVVGSNIANVLLLTVSTMQWGFGDRLVVWLRLCEGVQC